MREKRGGQRPRGEGKGIRGGEVLEVLVARVLVKKKSKQEYCITLSAAVLSTCVTHHIHLSIVTLVPNITVLEPREQKK